MRYWSGRVVWDCYLFFRYEAVMKKWLVKYWYAVLIGLFFVGTAAVYIIFGESSYIAVHDNLDLFVAQFQMLKNTDGFFAHGVDVPFLGGITRDNLPSEWSLYTLLYAVMPSLRHM